MKKRIQISLCMLSAILLFGGCASQIPDMTEEQRSAISEYAVGLLLKYDTSQPDRLVDLSLLEEEQPEATPEPVVTPEPEATQEPQESTEPDSSGMDPVVDTPTVSVGQETIAEEYDSVESTLLLPEYVSLGYCDYQVTDTYTDPRDAELILDAQTGNKLLVVRFRFLNSGSAVQNIDMLQENIKYSVVLDETSVNAMVTLLSNDLITYMGALQPDESAEVVLLAEVQEGLIQGAENIAVTMSCGEFFSKIDLK